MMARTVFLPFILALAALALPPTNAGAQPARAAFADRFAAALTAVPPATDQDVTGSIYVPAYPEVVLSGGRVRASFNVTLSIHNTSGTKPLVLRGIGLYDGAGQLVQAYLDKPVALRPFGTAEVALAVTDGRGGSGANFLVDWAGAAPIAEPLAETVMMGQIGTASYAFVSQGRATRLIERR